MIRDIIVAGGGIIGCAIAYSLQKRGRHVTLLERNNLVGGASGACDQGILLQSKAPGEHLLLGIYSMRMYENLGRELGQDLEFQQKGYMLLMENAAECDAMDEIIVQQRALGLPVERIGMDEALKRQPGISREAVVGATYCPWDSEVNPYKTTYAYADAAARLGAEIRIHAEVTGLIAEGGAVCGVRTQAEELRADTVVLACGARTPEIGRMAGLDIPIRPRRGQAYITEAVAPFIRCNLLNARYVVAKHHPELLAGDRSLKAKLGVGFCITQSAKGNVMFGASREFAGFDKSNTPDGLREILANAVRLMPGIRGLNVIRTMGGLRPYSPDSKPLIGYVDGRPGLFLAAGHEGDGVSLAPATGKMAADLILDGKTDIPAAASFNPNRFSLIEKEADARPITAVLNEQFKI